MVHNEDYSLLDVTLEEHAEAWARENGETIPPRDTPEHWALYERWVERAFQNTEA